MECILPANARSEVKIDAARVGDALLDGIIDRLEINDGYAIITDYKTGAPLSSFTTRDKTKEVKAWRHRSQLIFYALLLKSSSSFPSINSVAGQVIYLEADSIKDFSKTYNPTDDEIERMGRLVNKVWQLIIKLDFPDTAKYTDDLAGILRFEEDLLNGN